MCYKKKQKNIKLVPLYDSNLLKKNNEAFLLSKLKKNEEIIKESKKMCYKKKYFQDTEKQFCINIGKTLILSKPLLTSRKKNFFFLVQNYKFL